MIKTIVKREGYVEHFNAEKIIDAIINAMNETSKGADLKLASQISKEIHQSDNDGISIEEIQDLIESKLMKSDRHEVAKKYILYREERAKERVRGWEFDELQNAIWTNKYQHDGEDFHQWIERVSAGNYKIAKLMKERKFLFGGRILAHRGLDKKVTLSNCYVLSPPEDNIESIFNTAKNLARTFSYGGGCGVDISKLRPRGSEVNNSARETTGAVSFMELYDVTTSLIGQNGRRGALMISIADNHPDIEEFINVKTQEDSITKANISIRISDEFMKAVKNDDDWKLSFTAESTGEKIEKTVKARELFRKNSQNNWDWAEAGMLYWSRISNWHMMSEYPGFEFAGVNPCAEEPLMAGGSCLLGSLNLSEFVINPFTDKATLDIKRFERAVMDATVGLNEVLEEGLPLHPLDEQKETVNNWKQIGLGVMGIADMLIKMGVKYGSKEAIEISEEMASTLLNSAVLQSSLIAKEEGSFPMYDEESLFKSKFFIENVSDEVKESVKKYGLRNSQLLTIAPTGSLSTMLGISGGIEPIYNTSYTRKTESLHDKDMYYKVYTPIVKQYMDANGIKNEKNLPEFFVTAMSLDWKGRVDMQSIWQKYIDASISSTVNLPNKASVEEVEELFTYAWEKGLKGITIFRDGCKRAGILSNIDESETKKEDAQEPKEEIVTAYDEDEDKYIKCTECGESIEIIQNGCSICMNCGHSPCN